MGPDRFTFVPVTNACASLWALEEAARQPGSQAHEQNYIKVVVRMICLWGSGRVYMYSKCGSMQHTQLGFNKMPSRDVVIWNAMIYGHVKYGPGHKGTGFISTNCNRIVCGQPLWLWWGVVNTCASVVAHLKRACALMSSLLEVGGIQMCL